MVKDFSLFTSPGMERMPNGDPHAAVACLHNGPRIFYSPCNTRDGRGTWVIVRAQDQRKLLQDTGTFSSHRSLFASALGENWPLIPLELDPPAHSVFRSLLNPLLSPRRIMELEPAVRDRAIALISSRIPDFRIKDGTAPITYGGHVFGMENLILDWS
ncbi:cytochrome P450 protein (plasmid) [Rhizobium etli bv. phaseoli str. IE4803]|nr:cytochrome P450 protein [Rhizobium etli bv. phaseoli str. IE4803]ARQ60798.1 cytochrome P450 protein [Rhizobium sp. Kim5]